MGKVEVAVVPGDDDDDKVAVLVIVARINLPDEVIAL